MSLPRVLRVLVSAFVRSALRDVGRVVCLLLLGAVTGTASAQLTITSTTGAIFPFDSNKCATTQGPRAMYIGYRFANTSGSTQANLKAALSLSGTGFTLAAGQVAEQYLGTLANNAAKTLFWYVTYPCTDGATGTMTVRIADDATNATVQTSAGTYTTASMLSANAGAEPTLILNVAGAVVGQIVSREVTFKVGNIGSNNSLLVEPVGNLDFDASCLQLIGSRVTSVTNVTGVTAGATDTLYFTGVGSGGGQNNSVVMQYDFMYTGICSAASGEIKALPFSYSGSGTQIKYLMSSGQPGTYFSFPPSTNALTVSKRVAVGSGTPAAAVQVLGGSTVTYTVTITNSSAYTSHLSKITDVLPTSPAAVTYGGIASGSGVTAVNSAVVPVANRSSSAQPTLVFRPLTSTSYQIPANSSLVLKYTVTFPTTEGVYRNSATAGVAATTIYTTTTGTTPAAATVTVNTPPVAVNDSATTSANTARTFSVTANDTDTPPGTVSVGTVDLVPSSTATRETTYTDPGKGTFTVDDSGNVTFTPVAGYIGTATATYTMQDNLGGVSNTATITVTVTASADLSISKTGTVSAVQGNTVSYTLKVWNQGPSSVTGAAVTDPVPANLTGVTWTCTASGSAGCGSVTSGSGNSVALTTAALPVNASATAPTSGSYLTLTVTGTATTVGSFTNRATVAVPGGVTDPASGNDFSSQATTVTAPLLTCSALYGLFGGDFTTNNNGTTVRALGDTTNTVGATVATVPADANGNTGYSATLGIAPGGGTLYVARDSDRALLKYDVASATWSTLATLTAGATPSRLVRMTVGPDGTGYAMDGAGNFYTFGAASSGSIAPQTLTRLPSTAPAFGDSGDFFADASGRLFLLSSTGTSSLDFWEISPSTGLAAYLGRITSTNIGTTTYGGFAVTPNGVYGRGSTGQLIKVDLVNLTVSAVGTANTPSTDLASCTFPAYARTITALKTATKVAGSSGADIQVGDTVEYAITIRNGGSVTVGAMRLQDSLPAGTTYVAGSAKLNGTAVADVSGAMPYTQANQYVNSPGQATGVLLADSTPGTLDREAVVLFRVTVNAGAKSVSNQGTVTYLDGVTRTQQTDDPGTSATPDATISVVNTPPVAVNDSASAAFNTAVTFSLTANDTDADGNGTLNPASTVFATSGQPTGAVLGGGNRTVQVPGQGTYTLDNSGGVTFTPVSGYSGTTSPVLYTVQDTAGGTSNTATIQVQVIVGVADLTLVKTAPAYSAPSTPANPTATPPAPAVTRTLTYTLTATNSGNAATSGTVTVVDTLPAGLTATALGGTGWTCTLSTLTCTRADALPVSGSYPAITLTLNAPSTTELETNASLRDLTNSARVSGGGETNTGNNAGTANTKMVYAKLTKRVRNFTAGTAFGNASAGQPGQVLEYCLDFTNYGGAALSGFRVTDNVPGTTAAVTTGYDADEPSTATGFGMRLTRGAAVSYLTSAVDTGVDRGSLATSGGSFGSGVMEVVLPTALASGETGSVCFKARIN